MNVLDVILKVIGTLGGVIGAALGIYNYVHARRKEAREQQEKEQAKRREDQDWEVYVQSLKSCREGYILIPEDGSEAHKSAERLVARGMLERAPGGRGYSVPGQKYLIG